VFLDDPDTMAQVQSGLQNNVSNLVSVSTNYAQILGNLAVNFVTGFVKFLAQLAIVLVLSIFFSIEKR
jgi:predicted PurR-regulated permease PerM